jgi:prephenate dehydrogenase
MFETVAIVGPGLIGGSMGMALRTRGLARHVVGIGRRRKSLSNALEVGAIDAATLDVAEGVQEAELVVLATPIGTFAALMAEIAPAMKPGAVLTDVASTKTEVVETISACLQDRPDIIYVPAHPMAGSERRGPLAANEDLFEGAVCIITPLADTYPEDKSRVTDMWEALGCRVVSMTPQGHDRAVARISHVPHLSAAALINSLEEADMRVCGSGLIDTTRVASGPPSVWLDICLTNRKEIAEALENYITELQELVEALESNNVDRLREALRTAKERRDGLRARGEPRRERT